MAARHPRPTQRTAAPAAALRVERLTRRHAAPALARLRGDVRVNLPLLDFVHRLGAAPPAGEPRAELLAAWRGPDLVGVAARRPTLVLDAHLEPDVLAALVEPLSAQASGLVRSPAAGVEPLWKRLAGRGRRAMVDRTETAYAVEPAVARSAPPPPGVTLRPARGADLEALVEAARASLREEGRPDPFEGDPRGFRRWVRARVSRACVAERGGAVVFVGYADVRLPEGWLLQGVYTWPHWRRRGLAAAGVASLCRMAREAGADHVQLSVVDGNRAAERLYQSLGFAPFATLRTLLFV